MAKWTLPKTSDMMWTLPDTPDMIPRAEAEAMAAAALREAAEVMGEYHWNRYASREEGGSLKYPAVFNSHTHQAAQELILALITPEAQTALDRALAAERERCAKVALAFTGHDAKAEGAKDAGEGIDLACDLIAAAIRAQGET